MDRVLAHARREFPGVAFDRVDDQWRAASGATVLHADSVAALCAELRKERNQADALAAFIGQAFLPWRIWRAHGIWYATDPCPQPGCVCSRTLHTPSPSGLCRRLDGSAWPAQSRQGASR